MEKVVVPLLIAALAVGIGYYAYRAREIGRVARALEEMGREVAMCGYVPQWVAPEKDIDPVCGRMIETRDAKPSVFDGWVYYFCSTSCREAFELDPRGYARGRAMRAG